MSSAREKGIVEKTEPPSGGRDRREAQTAIYLRGRVKVDPPVLRSAGSSRFLTLPPGWSRKIGG
jgi:hypothetical protein